jgi:hypothetical protein
MELNTIIAIYDAGGNDAVDTYLSHLDQESLGSLEAASNMSASVIASTLATASASATPFAPVMVSPPDVELAICKFPLYLKHDRPQVCSPIRSRAAEQIQRRL